MGTPIPIITPPLLDDKLYCTYLKHWFPDPPVEECSGIYTKEACCVYGYVLNIFLFGGHQCKGWPDVCSGAYFGPKSIEYLTGPYETANECGEVCPETW